MEEKEKTSSEDEGSVLDLEGSENIFYVKEDRLEIPQKQLKKLSSALASGHLNVLLGSGFSASQIPTLSHREEWFTKVLDDKGADSDEMRLLQAEYGISVLEKAASAAPDEGQVEFIRALRDVLKNRGNTSIPRRANIFTTNYDMMVEGSCEEVGLPYNDGFSGRLNPVFSTESFSRVLCEQSFAHEYLTQIPTVSVMKMHGSLSWVHESDSVLFVPPMDLKKLFDLVRDDKIAKVIAKLSVMVDRKCDDAGLNDLTSDAITLSNDAKTKLAAFAEAYETLCIVNPTKRKFKETILELGYYELLRLFSNEMDRNNALLLSLGFSFRDEHILQITKRALGNPKLILIVFCYSKGSFEKMRELFEGFDNVWFVVGEDDDVKINASVAAKIIGGVVHNG